MREDRASPKCAMLLVFVGFCLCVLALEQFIHDLSDGVILFEALKNFFWGVVMLILGLLILCCDCQKGAYSPPRNTEIDDVTYLE